MQENRQGASTERKELLDSNDIVYLLIEDEQNRILLVERGETRYSLPAGHIRNSEKPLAAAIREGQEELGISMAPENLHMVHILRLRHSTGTKKSRRYFFKVDGWEGRLTNAEPSEHAAVGWHQKDETLFLKLPEHMKPCFENMERGVAATSFSYKTQKSNPSTGS